MGSPKRDATTIQKPINIAKTNNLESVTQFHDGTIKIRFDHSKPKIPPMIKYTNSRHSFLVLLQPIKESKI